MQNEYAKKEKCLAQELSTISNHQAMYQPCSLFLFLYLVVGRGVAGKMSEKALGTRLAMYAMK